MDALWMKMFLNKSAYADNNLSVKNENINGAIVKVCLLYTSDAADEL